VFGVTFGEHGVYPSVPAPSISDPQLNVTTVSFLAIIPLEKTFDWLGEELALYTGAVRLPSVLSFIHSNIFIRKSEISSKLP
jgi:hypothetical protein